MEVVFEIEILMSVGPKIIIPFGVIPLELVFWPSDGCVAGTEIANAKRKDAKPSDAGKKSKE
jgi:hypothetical protein